MRTAILLLVAATLCAKGPREWKTGYVREASRFQREAAAPLATGSSRPSTILLDYALRNKVKTTWGYAVEGTNGLVFLLQSKKAIDIEIDAPVKFFSENGDLTLIDKHGKERKAAIMRQTSLAQIEAESR